MFADRMNSHRHNVREAKSSIQEQQRHFKQTLSDRNRRLRAQNVDRPWLAGRSTPLSRDITLPAALRADVDTTLLFGEGEADLPGLAARITRATGIAVRISPEAMLPLRLFLPRLHTSQDERIDLPQKANLSVGPQALSGVLDGLSARLGIYWRYRRGAIEFYRTETRTFVVRALSLASRADARLGRSGKNKSGGFENTSHTTLSSEAHDTLDAVRARIEPFLSRAGLVAAQPGADTSVVVTDTPDALARVAAFLQRENQSLTRRVRLLFEEITVVANDEAHLGIDWNAIYATARAAAAWSTPAQAADSAAHWSGGATGGPFNGSQAIVSALSRMGTVIRRNSVPVLTLNRRPVTHAVRTTFSYIDQIRRSEPFSDRTGNAASGGTSVSVSQKEETVGSFLTLVPDVQEDGQILLSVAYDNTVAKPLQTITFGEGDNQVQIQQITIDGDGTVQQVALRPGQPMIISGFDRRQDELQNRRLSEGLPLLGGGLDRLSHVETSTLLIVTAQAEEGF
jgi:type IVB pilus formation R64 PilN family outer membrane protein